MSDATILYAGIVCFGLAVLGMVLTVYEFRKMGARRQHPKPRADLAFRV